MTKVKELNAAMKKGYESTWQGDLGAAMQPLLEYIVSLEERIQKLEETK